MSFDTSKSPDEDLAQKRFIISLMDLTSLNEDDDKAKIEQLCGRAETSLGLPAALCIYSQFLPIADKKLTEQNIRSQVKLATVANFPLGGEDSLKAGFEVEKSIKLGADEVDIVFPYRALLNGDSQKGVELVRACRKACGDKTLKVILETGELNDAQLIAKASEISIGEGADFIKTSTGKVAVNATLQAAEIMLTAIANFNPACGFKAAGGVRSQQQAEEYLDLTAQILGQDWITPYHFRFGTSSLLDSLLAPKGEQENRTAGY